jgi:phosphatidylinositol alpha-1,6-mannosyltransferase
MQRPVIASRVGGVPEIVLENESGWTIANEAITEWISKIRLVLNDGRIRRKMGEQGRAWVASRFNWNTIAAQVERILVEASMA